MSQSKYLISDGSDGQNWFTDFLCLFVNLLYLETQNTQWKLFDNLTCCDAHEVTGCSHLLWSPETEVWCWVRTEAPSSLGLYLRAGPASSNQLLRLTVSKSWIVPWHVIVWNLNENMFLSFVLFRAWMNTLWDQMYQNSCLIICIFPKILTIL